MKSNDLTLRGRGLNISLNEAFPESGIQKRESAWIPSVPVIGYFLSFAARYVSDEILIQ